MIGSDQFWNSTGYESQLLTKTSDFSMQAGQHYVTYEENNSLPKGQYYLYMSTIITVIVVLEVTTNGRMIQTTPMHSLL